MSTPLKVLATDPDGGNLSVSFYGRPSTTTTGADFTLVALPDTQNYTILPGGADIFNAQTQWIADNQLANNIVFATHTGDITQNGDYNEDESQWIIADNAFKILERNTSDPADDVPFSVSKGNHDVTDYYNYFEKYFGIARFSGRPYYGGHYGGDNLNSYSVFSASGMRFIVINLAYDEPSPTAQVLEWADGLLKDDLSRRGIVVLHDLMDGVDIFSYAGQTVYDALKDNPNLFLMLCGHYVEGRRTDAGTDGHPIYTVMADYQSSENGGDGWLRSMEFKPGSNLIQVNTFSPTRNNGAGDYQTDDDSQFALPYPMRSPDFTLIGTVTVPSGSQASVTWAGLSHSSEYEWYAAARDQSQITVGPVQRFTTVHINNNVPAAHNDSYSTVENSTLNISAPGVLSNDTDADGNPLTASKQTGPAHGTLALNSNGSFTYHPASDYYGPDSFTYKAFDSLDYSPAATVNISVLSSNHPPDAVNDSAATLEDTPVEIDVLNNDDDLDEDALTVTNVSDPPHGTAAIQANGRVYYTPEAHFYGQDSFQYTISDGEGTDSASVSVTVTHVNHPPAAQNGSLITAEEIAKSVTLTGSDSDGDDLDFSLLTPPAHGTLSGTPPVVTYTPDPKYHGPDSFTFRSYDGLLYSAPAAINITVQSVNEAPVLAEIGDQQVKKGSLLLFTASVTDADIPPDPITFRLQDCESLPEASIEPSLGVFTWTPGMGQRAGTYACSIWVSDGIDEAGQTVQITVLDTDLSAFR